MVWTHLSLIGELNWEQTWHHPAIVMFFLCFSSHTLCYTVFLRNHTMVYLASSLVFFSLLFSTPFLFGWFTNGSHIIESSLKHFSAQYTSTTLSRTFWSYLLSCLNPTSECVSYFYSPIDSRKTIVAEILTVLFVGSEFWQLGFTQCFFMETENSKTLGYRENRGR